MTVDHKKALELIIENKRNTDAYLKRINAMSPDNFVLANPLINSMYYSRPTAPNELGNSGLPDATLFDTEEQARAMDIRTAKTGERYEVKSVAAARLRDRANAWKSLFNFIELAAEQMERDQ